MNTVSYYHIFHYFKRISSLFSVIENIIIQNNKYLNKHESHYFRTYILEWLINNINALTFSVLLAFLFISSSEVVHLCPF